MNYYQILEVSKDASTNEIKNSYKRLIKKYHPDIYKGNKEYAEKITRELNNAYDVLSDGQKRAEYDAITFSPPANDNLYTNTNSFQNKTYYSKTYQNYYPNEPEEKKEDFIMKFKNKMYEYVDKRTKNLPYKSRVALVIIIILLALLFTLVTITDYLKILNHSTQNHTPVIENIISDNQNILENNTEI